MTRLSKLLSKVPDMYVQPFRDTVYDISPSSLPPAHLTTILSHIEANHVRFHLYVHENYSHVFFLQPMVYNVLIDQRSIENLLLIPDREQATQV